ncbi:MAG: outer membrane protein transport protein [Aeromonas sp.]
MTHFKKSLLAATVALASCQVNAAAFQLVEHSAAGLGRAFAGEAAVADNASVLARNPAAMTRFERTSVSGSLSYIRPDVDVDGDLFKANGSFKASASEKNVAPHAFVPASYFIQPLKKDLAWGVALFSNYGLATDYSDTNPAGLIAGSTDLMTVNFNPNLAWKMNDKLSLGAGLNLVYAKAELNRYAGDTILQLPLGGKDGKVAYMQGDDWGFGWNVGSLYEFNADHRVALTYRSSVKLDFSGDFIYVPAGINTAVDGRLDIELPAQAELAGYHRLNNAFAVHYSVNWTDWSVFKELKGCAAADADKCFTKPENFKDALRYSIGSTWYVSPQWEARVGLAYDESPIPAKYRGLSIPDADRVWYSAGITHHYSKDTSFDFGMTFVDGKEVVVSEVLTESAPLGQWQGSSHGNAFLLSAGVNMKF